MYLCDILYCHRPCNSACLLPDVPFRLVPYFVVHGVSTFFCPPASVVSALLFWATVTSSGSPYAMGPLSFCLSVALVYCSQRVGWIQMPLGMEVGLIPGNIVFDGDPAPPTEMGTAAPALFGPCLLWPNNRPSQQLLNSCFNFPSVLRQFCLSDRKDIEPVKNSPKDFCPGASKQTQPRGQANPGSPGKWALKWRC